MSFISLSNSYARNFSITSDLHLQTYSSNLSFPIKFCHRYFPLLDFKPGRSCKAIIALFLIWQLLSVVHSVFLSNLFPPKLFPSYCTSYFIFGACELFLPKVTYKAFFFNWTYTLSLSGIQRYSFFLFVYS